MLGKKSDDQTLEVCELKNTSKKPLALIQLRMGAKDTKGISQKYWT
jgi:hypothetical protein